VTGNLLHGWRVGEFGRSRDGVAVRAFFPEGSGPIAGLLVAAQHGEEAVNQIARCDTPPSVAVGQTSSHGRSEE